MLATDELGWILSLLEDHTIIFDVLTDRFVRKFKKNRSLSDSNRHLSTFTKSGFIIRFKIKRLLPII